MSVPVMDKRLPSPMRRRLRELILKETGGRLDGNAMDVSPSLGVKYWMLCSMANGDRVTQGSIDYVTRLMDQS